LSTRIAHFLAVVLLPGLAFATRTLNHGIHAVPAPSEVVLDGSLDEWDTSGAIVCCRDLENLLQTESARVSTMWDEANLYVAIKWRDATPLQNPIDPVTMPGNGWRSDCVQLRCNMDGFVSHVDCWYYTEGKRPAMTIQYKRMGPNPGTQPEVDRSIYPEELGAAQAFRPAPDGKGYVQEIRLPWAVITLDGKQPAPAADLRLGVELLWGSFGDNFTKGRVADNVVEGFTKMDFFWTAHNSWGRLILEKENHLDLPAPEWARALKKEEPRGTVAIPFDLPRESFVTIALEDARGNRVKSLVGGVRFPAGKNTAYWSGLDDRNELLPAGAYRWTGLYRDVIHARWLMSFYQPNTALPWNSPSGRGAWGPDHGNLLSAASGEGLVFLVGMGTEAGNGLFAVDQAGNKQWSVKLAGGSHLAYEKGILYVYMSHADWNPLGLSNTGLSRFEAGTGKWLDIKTPEGDVVRRHPLLEADKAAGGFAVGSAGLYLSVPQDDQVLMYDKSTLAPKRTFAVSRASALFAAGEDRVLVCSAAGLLELNPGTGEIRRLADGDLGAAPSVTEAPDGRIYVARGEPHHQVWVYERKGVVAVRTGALGKAGGRTRNGWYDPNEGFICPCGLAVHGQDRLWVVENTHKPKRVSVWQDGRWQQDFIGDTYYGGGGMINPLDPTMAFYADMQFQMDLDTGAQTLRQIGMAFPENLADFGYQPADLYALDKPEDFARFTRFVAHEGRSYIYHNGTMGPPWDRGSCIRQIYREREDQRWGLCVLIDRVRKFAWADANDDWTMQQEETFTCGEKDAWGRTSSWGMYPSQNLDLYWTPMHGGPGLCLRLQGLSPRGTPLYDFGKLEPMAGECDNGVGLRDGSYFYGSLGDSRMGRLDEVRKVYPAGTDRRTFWFRGFDTKRWTHRFPAPGIVLAPGNIAGVADLPSIDGEVVCVNSDFGQRYLLTDDALYVDQVFQDSRTEAEPWPENPEHGFVADNMAPGQESFQSTFCRLADGRYILTSGFTDCRVFQLAGLDSIRRFGGTVALREEDRDTALAVRRFRMAKDASAREPVIARVAGPVAADGDLSEWPDAGTLAISVDENRSAEVRCAYGPEGLYVAWSVQDPSPMQNEATRWELAFTGGDAVDVMFRVPGGDTDAADPREGDVRVLITRLEGSVQAVLYRPISATKQPFLFDAFEGAGRENAVKMDEVRLAPEVKTGIAVTSSGYVVEAHIPWSLLGASAAPGGTTRMDFGVLFSGASRGAVETEVRAYWKSRDTNITSDIPSEARLDPTKWGTVKFGK